MFKCWCLNLHKHLSISNLNFPVPKLYFTFLSAGSSIQATISSSRCINSGWRRVLFTKSTCIVHFGPCMKGALLRPFVRLAFTHQRLTLHQRTLMMVQMGANFTTHFFFFRLYFFFSRESSWKRLKAELTPHLRLAFKNFWEKFLFKKVFFGELVQPLLRLNC